MAKKALSLLLCLVMVFSLSIGCMTGANALDLSDAAAKLPVITGQPKDAVIEGTGSATFTVQTVFDDLLDQIKSGEFDLEAWLNTMLEQGLDLQTIIGILEEMGFNWNDIVDALQKSGIDWEQILKALQGGGFDLEEILRQLVKNTNFDIVEIITSLIGNQDIDVSALIKILDKIIGSQAAPLAVTANVSPSAPVEIDVNALIEALQKVVGENADLSVIVKIIQDAMGGELDLAALIEALQKIVGEDVDLSVIVKIIQDAAGGELDLAALIEALQKVVGDNVDLSVIVKIIQDAMGGELDLAALIEALQKVVGEDVDLSVIVRIIQGAASGELDLAALIEALQKIVGEDVDLSVIVKIIQDAMGGELDLAALIEALQKIVGEDVDLSVIVKIIQDAMGGELDLAALIEALQKIIGEDVDLSVIVKIIQDAMGGELDVEALIKALIDILGEHLDLQELIDALKGILGEDFDLEAVIKALINGGFDLNTILEILKQMGYTPEDLFNILIGKLISYQWYTRAGDAAVAVTAALDENRYEGMSTNTLTVTRDTAPDKTVQYTYFCTVTVANVTYNSKDAVLTIEVKEPPTPVVPDQPELNRDDHMAYLSGYPDGTVRPEANITRAEVATIFYNLLTEESRAAFYATSSSFTDVPSGKWYTISVATLAKAGILHGYPDNTFRPDDPISRAEMATVIALFAEMKDTTVTFRDIQRHWAQTNIELAASNGWISGYPDGTFRPDQSIKRSETVVMVNNALGRAAVTVNSLLPGMKTFSDNTNPAAWYYVAIQEAANSHEYIRNELGVESWTALT